MAGLVLVPLDEENLNPFGRVDNSGTLIFEWSTIFVPLADIM